MSRRILRPALSLAVLLGACDKIQGPRVPTRMIVTPAAWTISETGKQQFTAMVLDQDNKPISDRPVTWQSDHPELVSIDATGLATASSSFLSISGTLPAITITATTASLSGKTQGSLTITGTFDAWPDTNLVYVGMTRAIAVRLVKSTSGYPGPQRDTTEASWTSSDANVASVSATGVFTAVSPGHAQIVAANGNRRDTVEVYVVAAPTTPLRFTALSGDTPIVGLGRSSTPLFGSRGCGVATDQSIYCWGATLDATQVSDRCELIGPGGVQGARIARFRCSEIPLRIPTDIKFTSVVTIGRPQTAIPITSSLIGGSGCGLATTRRVYCWGTNRNGELGIGTTDTTVHGIAPIAGTDEFTEIHGSGSVCGIRTDGVLRCWGPGYGSTPTTVTSDKTWRMLAENGGCGLASDSTAYCFGTTAQSIGGSTRWKSIATSGRGVTCALALDDSVYCGSNLQTKQSPAQPAASFVSYLGDARTDGTGRYSNVCGLTASGDLLCADDWAAITLPAKPTRFNGLCFTATDEKVYCRMSLSSLSYVAIRGQ